MACLRVSIAAGQHHGQYQVGEERAYLAYTSTLLFHHQRKSGQELKQDRALEAGADAEAMEGCCVLVYSPWLTQTASL